jgi:hypothetical protein
MAVHWEENIFKEHRKSRRGEQTLKEVKEHVTSQAPFNFSGPATQPPALYSISARNPHQVHGNARITIPDFLIAKRLDAETRACPAG